MRNTPLEDSSAPCASSQSTVGSALVAEAPQGLLGDDALGLDAQVLEHLLGRVRDARLALERVPPPA